MISVNDLTFSYKKQSSQTLKGISFEVADGEIFGFLGPSGAGKSTTQKVLTGSLKNYKGGVRLNDREINTIDKKFYEEIGVAFEFPNLYLKFTALENLSLFSSFYSCEKFSIESLMKDIIMELRQNGTTVFLTTHNMNDADELCDRLAFMVDGRLPVIETPENLKLEHGKKSVKVKYRLLLPGKHH
ncbi:MAG: ATP-binding cassette domain-containing protein [Prolixibacteraceae bacterium]|nr:ATP-binding cassette domain-containing protein [Prolixibacteraceae bacterium]